MLGRKQGLEDTAYTGKTDKKRNCQLHKDTTGFFKTKYFIADVKMLVGCLMLSLAINW